MTIKKIWATYTHWIVAALLGLAALVTFHNSLHNTFMMDDYGLILQETTGHNPARLWDQFVPNYRGLDGVKDNPDNVYYRPWAHVIPLGCYMIFQNQPLGYHVVNLILFWLAGLCIYGFIRHLFKNTTVGVLTGLLFIVHPINGLAVNYITASVFSVQVMAMMLGLWAAVKSSKNRQRWLWVLLAIFGFINALFCHETALAFPFYLTAIFVLVRRMTFKEVMRWSWPVWAVAAMYFVLRLSFASLKASIIDKVPDITFVQYAATFTKLAAWYFECLVTLQGIVLIWSTDIIKTQAWMWLAGLAAVIAVLIVAVMRWRHQPLTFWLTWIAIGFLPVTLACFFQPRSGLMIEPHWLIIASVGCFAAFAVVWSSLQSRTTRGVWMGVTAILMASLIAASWHYNRLWGNEEQYCKYWHQQTPKLKSVFFYLAGTYFQKKDWAHAKEFYHQALENEFLDYEVFNNLGLIAIEEGDLDAAEENFLQALEIHPNSSIAMTNLGAIAFKRGQMDQAEQYFRAALDLNVHLIEPRLNLAEILQQRGQIEQAIELYRQNEALDPMSENNLYDWLKADIRIGTRPDTVRLAEKILKISNNPEDLTQAGSILAQLGQWDLAQRLFEKVLRNHPDYSEGYLEAGKMLGNRNDFNGAIRIWQDGSTRFPQDDRFTGLILQAQDLQSRLQKP